jgi:four helix bundle protein
VAGLRSFKEFGAWQLAYALRRAVRPLCRRALDAKDFKLHGQIREAARSATRNIAEGFGRFKHGDFARFVRMAKASEVELLDHFNEAFDCGYVSDAERRTLEHAAKKAIKASNGLIRYLESTPDPPSPRSRRAARAP